MVDGRPVGAVRLKRTADASTLEAGIWLARSARGHGVGTAAIEAVAAHARAAGARAVVADTAAGNLAAQAAMRRAGFRLGDVDPEGRVRGTLAVSGWPPVTRTSGGMSGRTRDSATAVSRGGRRPPIGSRRGAR
jgi:RimJ/RimL family protein N-acetyltransferase